LTLVAGVPGVSGTATVGHSAPRRALLVHDRQEAADLRHKIWALILKHQGDLS
jgi:hypothetical protein